jgi:undecaprenyl-diphosphatase
MANEHVNDKQTRRLIPPALVLAALSALLAVGFLSISRAVVAGRTDDLDERLLLAMREPGDLSDPVGPRWVEELGRDMTSLGGVAVLTLITGFATSFFWLSSMHHGAVYIAAASLTAMLLSSGLKQAFDRPRPDLVPHGVVVYTSSFPSGHSTMAAAVYLTLGLVASRFVSRRRLKALFLASAVLITGAVGVSRVYLGVHWPTDVLAGWAIGAAWALLCWCAAVWLQARGMIERETDPRSAVRAE